MTALLTDNLPLLADAPDGIKKLRELILELAVRGKLVAQDPSDEPASGLLKHIAEEKARLVAESKIKKQKSLAKITVEEIPFFIPTHWEWVRLDSLLKKIGAGSTPLGGKQAYVAGGVKFLRSQNVWNEGLRLNDVAFIPEETHKKMSGTHVEAGDLLFNITGASIGRCAAVPSDFDTGNVSQHVTIIRPVSIEIQPFLHVVLVSQLVQQTVMDMQVGVSREGISIGKLSQFLIPFPPEAEQHRIVAKVDELMALCDRLEAQQADAESAHAQLVQTLLDSLTQASDATDLATNWQRLAEHFHTLFTTESSIDALKQTLLQLAVMGKLAPQDPNDEPANKLLRRIVSDRQQLANEGRFKKHKSLTEITEEEKLFSIPQNWEWARISSFSELKSGLAYKSEAFSEVGKNQVIRMGNIRPSMLRLETNPAFISNDLARDTFDFSLVAGDIVLTMTGTKGKQDYLYSALIEEKHLEQNQLFLNQRLCAVRTQYINHKFLTLILQDQRLLYPIFRSSTGTANQANIGMSTLNNWALPIPPLAEQNRIVNVADQVMNICEAIKIKINKSYNVHNLISSALIVEGLA